MAAGEDMAAGEYRAGVSVKYWLLVLICRTWYRIRLQQLTCMATT